MKIGIVGLGLMGGSFALDIKTPFPNSIIYGLDNSEDNLNNCLLYTSPSPRDRTRSRMPSSA